MNPHNPNQVILSADVAQRFDVLAPLAVTAIRKMGANYYNSPATRPLRDEIDRLKVESGLTENQFNALWAEACQRPNAAFERGSQKRLKLLNRIGEIVGFLGFAVGGAFALASIIPARLWSVVVCDSGYVLTERGGRKGPSRFSCVSGDSNYPVDYLMIIALNAIPAVILAGIAYALFAMWRRRRNAARGWAA